MSIDSSSPPDTAVSCDTPDSLSIGTTDSDISEPSSDLPPVGTESIAVVDVVAAVGTPDTVSMITADSDLVELASNVAPSSANTRAHVDVVSAIDSPHSAIAADSDVLEFTTDVAPANFRGRALCLCVFRIRHVADLSTAGPRELPETLLGLFLSPALHLLQAELALDGALYQAEFPGGAGGEELCEGFHAGQERVDGASEVHDLGGRDSSAVSEIVDEPDDGGSLGKLATPRGFRDDFHHELSSFTGRCLNALEVDSEHFGLLISISSHFGKAGFANHFVVSVGLLLSEDLRCFLLGKPEPQSPDKIGDFLYGFLSMMGNM
jgi:hypothetical protein